MSEEEARTAVIDRLMEKSERALAAARREADYNALATFDAQTVAQRIGDAELFVAEMMRLLGR